MFSQIKGHESVRDRLRESVLRNRLASTHLFSGISGIGKRALAFAFAQELLCESPLNSEACGKCGSCLRVQKGQHESLFFVEPQKGQIKIEKSREILNFLQLRSFKGVRVVVVDQVEKWNAQGANVLLKILEEPPSGTYFFLITESSGSLLSTIRSRSQIWHFSPLSRGVLESLSQERFGEPLPEWVFSSCRGSWAQALDLFEEDSFDRRREIFSLFLQWKNAKAPGWEKALEMGRELVKEKGQFILFVRHWQQFIRDACCYSHSPTALIHKDCEDLVASLSELDTEILQCLFEKVSLLEAGVSGHWDMQIAMENFILSV